MTIKEHGCVVLTTDAPDEGLVAGDVGIHAGGEACEVEFMTLTGDTIAIVTLPKSQVRTLNRHDVAHTRELQAV